MTKHIIEIPYYVIPNLSDEEEDLYSDLGLDQPLETLPMSVNLDLIRTMQPSQDDSMPGTVFEYSETHFFTTPIPYQKMLAMWVNSKEDLFSWKN